MMDESTFWQIIDDCRSKAGQDEGEMADQLSSALRALGPEPIRQFELRLMELMNRAYRWDIWGAAYWLNGGCSDDTFSDFRGNLVALGRSHFERILADPDILADISVDNLFESGFSFIPFTVYRKLTGKTLDLEDLWDQPDYPAQPPEPAGEDWDFDDRIEVAERLPRLFKKHPNGDE